MTTATPHSSAHVANPEFVTRTWIDSDAAKLDPVGLLVYRSNRLGDDQRVTNTGGGNTSSKLEERDVLTGKMERVLWVKGSGGDLRTAGREFFSSLSLAKLEQLKSVYAARAERGIKSLAEDDMVDLYRHCTWNLNPRATSIDTPLHAFVPRAHVDHTHPNALISIAACVRGEEVMREVYGTSLRWLPWMRPGFELGLALEQLCLAHPAASWMPRSFASAGRAPSPSSLSLMYLCGRSPLVLHPRRGIPSLLFAAELAQRRG